MVLTDTHTHLYYQTNPTTLEQQMQRCFDKGIERLFLPNVNSASIPLVFDVVEKYPSNCFPMLGLHPCDVDGNFRDELSTIRAAIDERKIYAIGEIGIDLYWDKTKLDLQEEAFVTQINWAIDLDKPIVIHCREAFNEVFAVLKKMKHEKLRGIFHCFTGDAEQAKLAIDLGFYLGIGGVVTYKKSGLDKVVENVPIDRIVLETDSPYLSPVPFRGRPNESSYLTYIADKLAELKGMPVEEIARITTENSREIFGV